MVDAPKLPPPVPCSPPGNIGGGEIAVLPSPGTSCSEVGGKYGCRDMPSTGLALVPDPDPDPDPVIGPEPEADLGPEADVGLVEAPPCCCCCCSLVLGDLGPG